MERTFVPLYHGIKVERRRATFTMLLDGRKGVYSVILSVAKNLRDSSSPFSRRTPQNDINKWSNQDKGGVR